MMKTRIFTYLAIAITLCLFHSTSLSAQKRPPVLNPPQRLPIDPLNLRQPKPKPALPADLQDLKQPKRKPKAPTDLKRPRPSNPDNDPITQPRTERPTQPGREPPDATNRDPAKPRPANPSGSNSQFDFEGLIIDFGLRALENRENRPERQPKNPRRPNVANPNGNQQNHENGGLDVIKGNHSERVVEVRDTLPPIIVLDLRQISRRSDK